METKNIRSVLEYVLESEREHYEAECATLEVDTLENHIYFIALLALKNLEA